MRVNGAALAASPTNGQYLKALAQVDQIASISAVIEANPVGQVIDRQFQLPHLPRHFVDRGAPPQAAEIFDQRSQRRRDGFFINAHACLGGRVVEHNGWLVAELVSRDVRMCC